MKHVRLYNDHPNVIMFVFIHCLYFEPTQFLSGVLEEVGHKPEVSQVYLVLQHVRGAEFTLRLCSVGEGGNWRIPYLQPIRYLA